MEGVLPIYLNYDRLNMSFLIVRAAYLLFYVDHKVSLLISVDLTIIF